MKKVLLVSVAALAMCIMASAVSSTYDVTVEKGGKALAVLVLSGEGTVNVPLPLDAGSPIVEGGVYVQAENGIDVALTESASVIYDTELLALEENGAWVLDLELPDTQTSAVTLSLPPDAVVAGTEPSATITQTADSRNLVWTLSGQDAITVEYSLEAEAAVPGGGTDYTLVIIILLAVVAVLALVLVKKKVSR